MWNDLSQSITIYNGHVYRYCMFYTALQESSTYCNLWKHANRQKSSQLRKHPHQCDIICAVNTHMVTHTQHNQLKNTLQVGQVTSDKRDAKKVMHCNHLWLPKSLKSKQNTKARLATDLCQDLSFCLYFEGMFGHFPMSCQVLTLITLIVILARPVSCYPLLCVCLY